MKKILPVIAIVSLAFSGSALAQGAISGSSGSSSTNLQEEAQSFIPYSPVEPEYGVPVISNPGQVIVFTPADANPAPGFMSDRTYIRSSNVMSPRGLTKLKGPVLDANGNHVYASEEVDSSKN